MYYVYEHIRLDSNSVFYVGKGSKKRYKSKSHRNKYWHNVVNKYGYKHRIVFEHEDEELIFLIEQELISHYRYKQIKLTNLTDGGCGGISGYKHTDKSKAKISKNLKGKLSGKKHPRYGLFGIDNPSYGKKQSDESRKKMSENCCMKNPEIKAKISGENSPKAVSVKYNNVIYPTLIQLAKATGVSVNAIRSRIFRGHAKKYGYNILGKTKTL